MTFRNFSMPADVEIKGRELKKWYCVMQMVLNAGMSLILYYFPDVGFCTEYPIEPHLRLGVDFPGAVTSAVSRSSRRQGEEASALASLAEYTARKLPWANLGEFSRVCGWEEVPMFGNCSSYRDFVDQRSVHLSSDSVSVLVSHLQTPPRRLAVGSSQILFGPLAVPVLFRVDLSWQHARAGVCGSESDRFCIRGVNSILVLNQQSQVFRRFDTEDFSLTLDDVLGISRGTPQESVFHREAASQQPFEAQSDFINFEPVMLLGSKIDADVRCYSERRHLSKRIKGDLPDGLSFRQPVCVVRFAWIGQARRVEAEDPLTTSTLFRNEVQIHARPGTGVVCVIEEFCILRVALVWLLLVSCPRRIVRYMITKHAGLLSRIYKREIFPVFSIAKICDSMAHNSVMLAVSFSKAQKEIGVGEKTHDENVFTDVDHYVPPWRMQERLDKATGYYFTDEVLGESVNFIVENFWAHFQWNHKYSRVRRSEEQPVQRFILSALGHPVEIPRTVTQDLEDEHMTASFVIGMCFACCQVNYVEISHLFDNRRPLGCLEKVFTPEYMHVLRQRYQKYKSENIDFVVQSLEDMTNFKKKSLEDIQEVNMAHERQLSDLQFELLKLQQRVDTGDAEDDAEEDAEEAEDKETSKPQVRTWRDWVSEVRSRAPGGNAITAGAGNQQSPTSKLSDNVDSMPGKSTDSPAADSGASAKDAAPSGTAAGGSAQQVYRDGEWVMVLTKDLLPGDLLRHDLLRQDSADTSNATPVTTSVEASKLEQVEQAESVEEAKEVVEQMEPLEDTSSEESTRQFVSLVEKLQAVLSKWEEQVLATESAHKEAQSLIQDLVKLPMPRRDVLQRHFKVSSETEWDAEVARYKVLSRSANKPAPSIWEEFGIHGHQDTGKQAPASPRISELQHALRQRSTKNSFETRSPLFFHTQEHEEKLKSAKAMSEEEVKCVIDERMAQLTRER